MEHPRHQQSRYPLETPFKSMKGLNRTSENYMECEGGAPLTQYTYHSIEITLDGFLAEDWHEYHEAL